MRHFILDNGTALLDITSTDILFHEISGLGFDEENNFKRIGSSWALNTSNYNQGLISGKMLFNCGQTLSRADDPYYRYMEFVRYISRTPLILRYYPFGVTESEEDVFYRKVRVSKLSKGEKNEYGVLDCDIEFTAYTPWYKIRTFEYVEDKAPSEEHHWVWDTPLVFEPTSAQKTGGAIPAIFDWEPDRTFRFNLSGLLTAAPVKLSISGPLLNPYWTHSILNGTTETVISTGRFVTSQSDRIEIEANSKLIIDNTDGNYILAKETPSGSRIDLYSKRDFGTDCFLNLRNGDNVIAVGSEGSFFPESITAEVHELYATI